MVKLIFILCFIFISCLPPYDCMDVVGGEAFFDDCGICSEGTSGHHANSDQDCDGICFGDAVEDQCGECNGDGTIECWNGWEECDLEDCPTYNSLDIYDVWKQLTDLEPDDNGYFHFSYEPTGNYSESDYGTVKYVTELPTTRVFWNSPDSFWVYHQGQWIGEPIICCSTYSGSDGYGQQLFYIYEPHIGDTLSIYGHVCEDTNFGDCLGDPLVVDSIFVIIED